MRLRELFELTKRLDISDADKMHGEVVENYVTRRMPDLLDKDVGVLMELFKHIETVLQTKRP